MTERFFYNDIIAGLKDPTNHFVEKDDWKKYNRTKNGRIKIFQTRKSLIEAEKFIISNDLMYNLNQKGIASHKEGLSKTWELTAANTKLPFPNMYIEFDMSFIRLRCMWDKGLGMTKTAYKKLLKKLNYTNESVGVHIERGGFSFDKPTKYDKLHFYRFTIYRQSCMTNFHELFPDLPMKLLFNGLSIFYSPEMPFDELFLEDGYPLRKNPYNKTMDSVIWGARKFPKLDEDPKQFAIMNVGSIFSQIPDFNMINNQGEVHKDYFDEGSAPYKYAGWAGIFPMILILVGQLNNKGDLVKEELTRSIPKKRTKIQKLYDHKTLIIDTDKHPDKSYEYIRRQSLNKNRYHSVRGHWRHYKNGKKTWITNYGRGDKEMGIITKDYKID